MMADLNLAAINVNRNADNFHRHRRPQLTSWPLWWDHLRTDVNTRCNEAFLLFFFVSLPPSASLWCGGVRQSVVCCCWGVSTTSLSVSFLFAPFSYITCLWWCWAQCSNFSSSCNWNRCSYKLEKVPVSLVSEALNRSVSSNFSSWGITGNTWTHSHDNEIFLGQKLSSFIQRNYFTACSLAAHWMRKQLLYVINHCLIIYIDFLWYTFSIRGIYFFYKKVHTFVL